MIANKQILDSALRGLLDLLFDVMWFFKLQYFIGFLIVQRQGVDAIAAQFMYVNKRTGSPRGYIPYKITRILVAATS